MTTNAELVSYKQVLKALQLAKSEEGTMATSVDNIVWHWLCVRPPEYRAEVSPLEARRMLVKLGELHRPIPSRSAKNPGATWGSTYHDGPCKERPNVVLEVAALHQERSKAELVPLGIL
jgi:hypothetical protein